MSRLSEADFAELLTFLRIRGQSAYSMMTNGDWSVGRTVNEARASYGLSPVMRARHLRTDPAPEYIPWGEPEDDSPKVVMQEQGDFPDEP